ncbi:hypothetical protein [Candidatus Endomicrobiellum trichonymphae]|uniref:hypothetical protein n=1 Tax=Endomicrobium trichonymphae TaxID=1408204 RepID=UPI000BBABEC0|nr:hypothetical protein [Candidatus Endomicrobium trichonymphae]
MMAYLTVKTVFATRIIPQGTESYSSICFLQSAFRKNICSQKHFQSIEDLFTSDGTAVYISLNTIEENEQILSTKISKTNQETGISALIPENKKALSVNFDIETSNILTTGASTYIFGIVDCRDYTDTNKELQESVFAVAQNVLVFISRQQLYRDVKKWGDDYKNVGIITLSVSFEEVQKILIASQRGSLKYVIRPAGDVEISNIKPLRLSSIVKDISKIALLQNNEEI